MLATAERAFYDGFFAHVQVTLQIAHGGIELAVAAFGRKWVDQTACQVRFIVSGRLATQRAHFQRA
jgi:hypothetical protein